MTYSIEKSRNSNLEDTAIPNLFITDFMPDVPDGDFVKVYIYAYMCCRQEIALTHTELADHLGLPTAKVLDAWRYFADRRIVKLSPQTPEDETHFDIEFIDVKGMLYVKEKPSGATGGKRSGGGLSDPKRAALLRSVASILGAPTIDGGDAQRIIAWLEEDGATPEIIEHAYLFCRDERGEKNSKYVGKVVAEWTEQGLKTVADVREYRAKTDARSGVHKKLMSALGMRYNTISPTEEKIFNQWMDEYGYTPEELLELAERTAGKTSKLSYLNGIIQNMRKREGKSADSSYKPKNKMKDRDEYYKRMRQNNEEEAAARLEEVYAALPAVKKADDEITHLNMELVKTLVSRRKDKESAVARLNREIRTAMDHRKAILAQGGFPPDHTDLGYHCDKCRDTGILENGVSCDCFLSN